MGARVGGWEDVGQTSMKKVTVITPSFGNHLFAKYIVQKTHLKIRYCHTFAFQKS